jgi:Mg-chelatase subunit ChlI
MAILDKLKFTSASKTAGGGGADPIHRIRARFIEALSAQQEIVQALVEGKDPKTVVKRYIKRDGQLVWESVNKRLRVWMFKRGAKFYTLLFYGTSPIKVGGHNAIECGAKLPDVLKTYETLIEATEAGEMDEALTVAAVRRRKAPPPEQPKPRARRP